MVGHTVLARLMESQIWHQPIGSVGGELSKGTVAFAHPDAKHLNLSLYTTVPFKLPSQFWTQREQV